MSEKNSLRLIQGTVDMLILQALTAAPNHGYGVSNWVRERTQGDVTIEDAALYKALHRLESQGLVESGWGRSDNNRRAKFYEITREGRHRLADDAATWRRYAAAVFRVLGPTPEAT
ncbi:MAG: PadR family transcriptional regulator [Thermoanaerobaculia bacterium]|nr:PadR family transcriptional regulator [Thermoanaerobaculia bacterium]